MGELFLMHWLAMKLERVIPATELFTTFRQWILTPDADAEKLIREICADAAVMRGLDKPELGTPEYTFITRLEKLDAGTVYPLVLLLFRSIAIPLERRRNALRILESWLTRRALTRLTTKNYNRVVARLIAVAKRDLPHVDRVLLDALAVGEADASRWPEDDEFVAFLTDREIYGTVSGARLSMAFGAVEESLYSSKTEIATLPQTLTIEHLMPQAWETNWPLLDASGNPLTGAADEAARAHRMAAIHHLGNLTIVTHPLNASLSNAAWSAKRDALNRESKLLLNARVAHEEEWDESDIAERSVWLAERMKEIWPGPDGSLWGHA